MTSYDRLDWHLGSVIEAGQPKEHAFTHIGLYLAWLIRHDLHDPSFFPSDHVEAVKRGDMTGSDLADDIDSKLVSHVMNAEGAAFSDARYSAYMAGYRSLFDDLPDYGVMDDPASYAQAERLLDGLYAEWIAAGRPTSVPNVAEMPVDDDFPRVSATVMVPPGFTQEQIDELLSGLPVDDVQIIDAPSEGELVHLSPELEALIPRDLTSPPMEISSMRATDWGSSLLNRALKRLGVQPKDARVVNGIGGSGETTLTVSLYSLPGIDPGRLESEFRSVIFLLPGSTWKRRAVAGREVNWASGDEFTTAFWAGDGMVVHVAGQPDGVEGAIPRLP